MVIFFSVNIGSVADYEPRGFMFYRVILCIRIEDSIALLP